MSNVLKSVKSIQMHENNIIVNKLHVAKFLKSNQMLQKFKNHFKF